MVIDLNKRLNRYFIRKCQDSRKRAIFRKGEICSEGYLAENICRYCENHGPLKNNPDLIDYRCVKPDNTLTISPETMHAMAH